MNKRYCIIALLICLILLVSACKKSGAASGGAPRTPFIGGTAGLTLNFLKGNPPPEVTDDESFAFNAILSLKNDGEFKVDKQDVKVELVGFDPNDFGKTFQDLRDQAPDDDLEARQKDAEGVIKEGTTTTVTFPKNGNNFEPKKFPGNTEFTFRAEACYYYETHSTSKLCILRDMINIRDGAVCNPNTARTVYSSSAPVQISNLRQSVVGKDKISFSFDISLNGNVDIFNPDSKPSSNFDSACPKDPKKRRQLENKVLVEITEIPGDPIVSQFKCGGLENNGFVGNVILVNNKRTITCTAELSTDRNDLEKSIGINVKYNVLDNKETKILVKHLAETS